MAYDEKTQAVKKPHTITLEDRCRLSVSGVEDVESFDETLIAVSTAQGELIIHGSGLHIGKINLDAGELRVEGLISELAYEEKRASGGFLQRLFG